MSEPEANWALIKHWHHQAAAESVYGPYTKAAVDWLLSELATPCTQAWTAIQMRDLPELTDLTSHAAVLTAWRRAAARPGVEQMVGRGEPGAHPYRHQ